MGSLESLASSLPCQLVLPFLCPLCSPYWLGPRSAVSCRVISLFLLTAERLFSALL